MIPDMRRRTLAEIGASVRCMLFLLFGASAAGKTTVLDAIRERAIPRLAVHDFDEIGVPSGADTVWRQRANEEWVRRAVDYQAARIDLLLAGQTPLGELLATPSASRLDAVSACLLDCDDDTRATRLRARGIEAIDDQLAWARWMRGHATDPTFLAEVIRIPETESRMRWERLGDVEWHVPVIDTSAHPVAETARGIAAWIADTR